MTKTTTTKRTPADELWTDYLEPLDLSVGDIAAALGISRKVLSAIINGNAGITPTMSVRLSRAIGTRPSYWAERQLEHDMDQVDGRVVRAVRRLDGARHAFVTDRGEPSRVRHGDEDTAHCATCGQAEDRSIHRVPRRDDIPFEGLERLTDPRRRRTVRP
jgi:addiction module HigA family antidote